MSSSTLLAADPLAANWQLQLSPKPEVKEGEKTVPVELPAGSKIVEAEGQALYQAPEKGTALTAPVPDELWKDKGSVSLFFRIEGMADTRVAPNIKTGEGYTAGKLFHLPYTDAHFFVASGGSGGINFKLPTSDGKFKYAQMKFSHFKGEQLYHLTLTWDFSQEELLIAYLNGVRQGDMLHSSRGAPIDPSKFKMTGPLKIGGTLAYEGKFQAFLQVGGAQLFDRSLSEKEVAQMVEQFQLTPVVSEGRNIFTGSLDLSPYQLKPYYEADFSSAPNYIHEKDLLDADGKRSKLPEGKDWVLEGDLVSLEAKPGSWEFTTAGPEERQNGAWVFWNTKTMPENFLAEYSFTPKSDHQGLNILFFSATNPKGGSLFDLDLPARRGIFGSYIIGEIDNYHVSPWATDGGRLRNSTNMRKNAGFMLAAIGNDVIGGSGPGPHTVRVLKDGGKIRVESNGVLALKYDDGEEFGPIYGDGLMGVRFMPHTESAQLHSFKVWELEKK